MKDRLERIREVVNKKTVVPYKEPKTESEVRTNAYYFRNEVIWIQESILEILNESPSNQCECWKSEESGAVYYAGCPIHRRDKKCSCTEDLCDPKCPVHEGYWINKGQVSPAAPHPKKNNTKECKHVGITFRNNGKSTCNSCDTEIVFLPPPVQSAPKKEERCTCTPGIKALHLGHSRDCTLHGEPKLPSEIIGRNREYNRTVETYASVMINKILDFLDEQHEADK